MGWLRRYWRFFRGQAIYAPAVVAFILVIVIVELIFRNELTMGDVINSWILAVLVIGTGFYAWRTHTIAESTQEQAKIAREQIESVRQANTFVALTQIHKTLSNLRNSQMREYLYQGFERALVAATKEKLGEDFVKRGTSGEQVDIDKVLEILPRDEDKLIGFNNKLKDQGGMPLHLATEGQALDIVEHVLHDFGVVAIPVSLGIEAAIKAAEAYKPIFELTAPHILPFVAIHRKLRGDPEYMKHYLHLLRRLNIDRQGVEPPD